MPLIGESETLGAGGLMWECRQVERQNVVSSVMSEQRRQDVSKAEGVRGLNLAAE